MAFHPANDPLARDSLSSAHLSMVGQPQAEHNEELPVLREVASQICSTIRSAITRKFRTIPANQR